MPSPPDQEELPLWEPFIKRARPRKPGHRDYFRDIEREIITIVDDFGITQLHLSELPGAVLKYALIDGVIRMLQERGDPHTNWRGWKSGKVPVVKKPGPKVQPKLSRFRQKSLGLIRQAIVAALGDQPHCIATVEEREAYVRTLTPDEVIAWRNEPDVRMHMRRLRNEPLLKTTAAVDQLNAELEKAAKKG